MSLRAHWLAPSRAFLEFRIFWDKRQNTQLWTVRVNIGQAGNSWPVAGKQGSGVIIHQRGMCSTGIWRAPTQWSMLFCSEGRGGTEWGKGEGRDGVGRRQQSGLRSKGSVLQRSGTLARLKHNHMSESPRQLWWLQEPNSWTSPWPGIKRLAPYKVRIPGGGWATRIRNTANFWSPLADTLQCENRKARICMGWGEALGSAGCLHL